MPIYRTTGTLTGYIEPENVSAAQAYLQNDDMTQYLEGLPVERIQWYLDSDGHNYYVEAITSRLLRPSELENLSSWVSGQNSDGLGEGFEQQDFAEERYDVEYEDDEDEYDTDGYRMISFDWETNNSVLRQIV